MSEPLVRKAGVLEDEMDLHLISLSVLLLDVLGPDYLAWTSDGLRSELEDRFGKIGVMTWERIQAARVLQAHDAFWKEWEVFENVTAAILGEYPIFSLVQPPEAEEIAISLVTAARVNKDEFSTDVKNYILASCLHDGLWYFEDPITGVVGNNLADYDREHGILRDTAAVASELQKSDKFRETSEDPILEQVNRVLDVRRAVRLYNEAVDKQLVELPARLKGK